MNERIEQCKADIAKLQEELKKLEDANKPTPRHGDLVRNCNGELRIVIIGEKGLITAFAEKPSWTGSLEFDHYTITYNYETNNYLVVGNVFDMAKQIK